MVAGPRAISAQIRSTPNGPRVKARTRSTITIMLAAGSGVVPSTPTAIKGWPASRWPRVAAATDAVISRLTLGLGSITNQSCWLCARVEGGNAQATFLSSV